MCRIFSPKLLTETFPTLCSALQQKAQGHIQQILLDKKSRVKTHPLPVVFQTGMIQEQLHQQQTLESERKKQASIFKVIKITRVIFLIDAGKPETHVDMESRLGVKVTALSGEPVLLIDIISHVL